MSERTLFHLLFVGQVVLISGLIPRWIVAKIDYVAATYPPEKYPRLYARPMAYYRRVRALYRASNVGILAIGLAMAGTGLYYGLDDLLNWDDHGALALYFLLQWSPLLFATPSGLLFLSAKRAADSRRRRTASLRPRRLSDYAPRGMLVTAIVVYGAFVGLILYVRQFDFPWFGGYWNIAGITGMNVFFLVVALRALYGKRSDPYQADPDRTRAIELMVRMFLLVSIVGTLKIALSIGLQAFELEHLRPIATTLYFQLIAVLSLRTIRVDGVDFEVYREEAPAV